jgi:hypothetical protein
MVTIAPISGSAQQNNFTEKAVALVHDELNILEGVKIVEVFTPADEISHSRFWYG